MFVHENPAHAKSWALPCIRRMAREAGVQIVEADQCMFGLKTWGKSRSQLILAKKPTKFMTNSQVLGRELSRKCDGTHDHQQLIDGRAKDAARYPPSLCRALCRGILKEKMLRATGLRTLMLVKEGVHMRGLDLEAQHEAEEADIEALLRKIESLEAGCSATGKAPGDPSVPGGRTRGQRPESKSQVPLGRLT